VRLEIADDGRGLTNEPDMVGGHHGLANLRARAESLGGTFDIESGEGAGTRMIVAIPRTLPRRGSSS
jgi:signal transduction histidine kinase